MTYTIIINKDRYPGIEPTMSPHLAITVNGGTFENAKEIAERLSNHNAGCDYSWYVVGD